MARRNKKLDEFESFVGGEEKIKQVDEVVKDSKDNIGEDNKEADESVEDTEKIKQDSQQVDIKPDLDKEDLFSNRVLALQGFIKMSAAKKYGFNYYKTPDGSYKIFQYVKRRVVGILSPRIVVFYSYNFKRIARRNKEMKKYFGGHL